jgi:hypothetical protein
VKTLLPLLLLLTIATAVPAEGFRDPMRPAGAATLAPSAPRALVVQALKLEGLISGEHRIAIINGRLVRPGDVVAGARILEVSASGVRYERAGKIHSLTLPVHTANHGVRVSRSPEPTKAEAQTP